MKIKSIPELRQAIKKADLIFIKPTIRHFFWIKISKKEAKFLSEILPNDVQALDIELTGSTLYLG